MGTIKYRTRHRRGEQITAKVIELYTRLRELEAMDLPKDDPRWCSGGEIQRLKYEIHRALDMKPWTASSEKWTELDKAAGHPYAEELKAIQERKIKAAHDEALHDLLNDTPGRYPSNWTHKDKLAAFERDWGYIPDEPE